MYNVVTGELNGNDPRKTDLIQNDAGDCPETGFFGNLLNEFWYPRYTFIPV